MDVRMQMFLLPDGNLRAAISRCLAAMSRTSGFLETVTTLSPSLTGEGKESFLHALHLLSGCSEGPEGDGLMTQICAEAMDALALLDGGEVSASDDDAAAFLEGVKELLVPIVLASRQLVANNRGAGPSQTGLP